VPTQQLVRLDQSVEVWPEFGGYKLRPRAVDLGVGATRGPMLVLLVSHEPCWQPSGESRLRAPGSTSTVIH
jgi:hypothetical protein